MVCYGSPQSGASMKWIFGLTLFLAAASAWGQSVYKCRDANGGLVYQSDPCANAEKRWDVQPGARYGSYAPDDQMTSFQSERSVARDRAAVRASNAPRYSGAIVGGRVSPLRRTSPISGQATGVACGAAKSGRDAARKAANTHWSFSAASSWDAAVRNACK